MRSRATQEIAMREITHGGTYQVYQEGAKVETLR